MTLGLHYRFAALLFLAWAAVVPAADPQPVKGADYPQAFKYTPENLRPFLYDTAVTPMWIGKTDAFCTRTAPAGAPATTASIRGSRPRSRCSTSSGWPHTSRN